MPDLVAGGGGRRGGEAPGDGNSEILQLDGQQRRLTRTDLLGTPQLDDAVGHHERRVVREDRVGHVVLWRQHLDAAAEALEQGDEVGVLTGKQVEIQGLGPVGKDVVASRRGRSHRNALKSAHHGVDPV